jgi:hypothetical protein
VLPLLELEACEERVPVDVGDRLEFFAIAAAWPVVSVAWRFAVKLG